MQPDKTRSVREQLDTLYQACRDRLLALPRIEDGAAGDYHTPVFGTGCCDRPTLMFIGEAPGKEEAKSGCPFVGRAGKQLDEFLSFAGIERKDIYITNAVKFRPVIQSKRGYKNRTPGREEILQGLPLLRQEITLIRPKLIVTLGNIPLRAVYLLAEQTPESIGAVHGTLLSFAGQNWKVYPMYHPASVIYRRELLEVYRQDAVKLGMLLHP